MLWQMAVYIEVVDRNHEIYFWAARFSVQPLALADTRSGSIYYVSDVLMLTSPMYLFIYLGASRRRY
jgi:hypothetical protein